MKSTKIRMEFAAILKNMKLFILLCRLLCEKYKEIIYNS